APALDRPLPRLPRRRGKGAGAGAGPRGEGAGHPHRDGFAGRQALPPARPRRQERGTLRRGHRLLRARVRAGEAQADGNRGGGGDLPGRARGGGLEAEVGGFIAAIVGPTAAGKTALALELAERIPLEVNSCDSQAVYRGMDVGTAKPTPEER